MISHSTATTTTTTTTAATAATDDAGAADESAGANERALRFARQVVAGGLSIAFTDPTRLPAVQEGPWNDAEMLQAAWSILVDATGAVDQRDLGLGEIVPARAETAGLSSLLTLEHDRRERAFRAIFGLLIPKECPPYETEYSHWKDPTYRAHQLADAAGFQNAFGLQPASDEGAERPDHISLELEFIAFLLQKIEVAKEQSADDPERLETCIEGLRHFVHDHIVWWAPTFGHCVERKIDTMVADESMGESLRADLEEFRAVAQLLRAWVAAERVLNGIEPARRIIAPQVEVVPPPEVDDSCESCAAC